jgi:hypothetical protein
MSRRTLPTRPYDAQCGLVFGENTRDDVTVVRQMKGPVRKTVNRREQCDKDAHYTIKLADGIGLAVCGTHHPEKVGGR